MKRTKLGVIGVKNNIFNLDPVVVGSKVPIKDLTMNKALMLRKILAGGGSIDQVVTGNVPLVLSDAAAKSIVTLTQYGLCTQAATPTPDAPVDIVCNNGALKMLNLANMAESNLDIGYYLNNSGVRTASALNFYTLGFIPVKPSTDYTMKTSAPLNYFSIMEYDSAQSFLKRTLWGAADSPAGDTTTFTTRSDTAYIRFGSNMTGYTLTYADIAAVAWMLTEGATAQDYVPYGQITIVGIPEVLTVAGNNYVSGGLTGYGTYVSPAQAAGNRAYKRLEVPNGTYQFAVDGDYEIIVQWRDPADPSVTVQSYENLSGWMTSGEVTLDKTSGGYGITVRRTSGSSITPSNFDGTLFCYKTSDIQTVTVPTLLSVGDYKDESELISGLLTHKVGIRILTGEETGWALSDSGTTHRFRSTKPSNCYTPASRAPSVCTHFKYVSTGSAVGGMFIGASQYWYFIPTDQTIDTVDEWTDWLASQYAAGTPVIVLYPLATETTEQTTAQHLSTYEGTNIVDAASNVTPTSLEIVYKKKK